MFGLNHLGRAVRTLASSLAALSATVDQANATLRRQLRLEHAAPEPVALPAPEGTVAPLSPSRRNGRAKSST